MWRDYSWSFIKNNRASGLSVVVAAFISALFLSLLSSLFYNFWLYDIDGIKAEEGGWQSRITGPVDTEDLTKIENYANIEKAVVNEKLSAGTDTTIDLYFHNMRTVFDDTPRIAALAGLEPETISYHYKLLSMYLIRSPQDTAPRLLFPIYLMITAMACISLIMIIHNSFAVSMNARIHQFGILSSIGATPGQIRACLLQEAAALCILPVIFGNLLGLMVSMAVIKGVNRIIADTSGNFSAVWKYHPLLFGLTLIITIITIWISAWIPAGKLSRLTPLEAIKNTGEFQLKKKKKSHILSFLFGIEGELAGNALKAQSKALRTAALSLTFSFLAFSLMQCFFTLSGISTQMTYFEKYQNAWDIMFTLKDTGIDSFGKTEELQALSQVQSAAVYQKAAARRLVSQEDISEELKALGGLQNTPKTYVSAVKGGWMVNAPVIILDDESFHEYCRQAGAAPRLDGAVILNRVRDSKDPDFRNKKYYPYLEENQTVTLLRQSENEEAASEIPVIAYTQEVPVLREEYGELDCSALVHFLPVSLWNQIKGQIGNAEEDTYIRVLAGKNMDLKNLNALEEDITYMLRGDYQIESENRIQEKITNDKIIQGYMIILGGFCTLLAIIGIGNVFSNTLSFIRQRKREFARYMSVGLTPEGIRKMFCIEALVIAGRPILITIPLTVIAVGLMLKLSYLEPVIFIREMPLLPICIFILAIFIFVSLAYYLGGRKILRDNPAGALQEDTLL